MTATLEERFWAKVDKSGECWLWTAAKDRWGYGSFWNTKRVSAHRFSYELHKGAIPAGLEVDHLCHQTLCVNPAHLRTATRQQNAQNLNGAARRNNKTGIRGVTWSKRGNNWRGQVVHQGRIYVKKFPTIEAAEKWVVAKRNELCTHNELDRQAAS